MHCMRSRASQSSRATFAFAVETLESLKVVNSFIFVWQNENKWEEEGAAK